MHSVALINRVSGLGIDGGTLVSKVQFSTYKPATNYSNGKAHCLVLEAHNNTMNANIAVREGRKYLLNDNMTDQELTALYLATIRALGTHVYSNISIANAEEADGLELWSLLDKQFDEKEE